jgi:signal transduction histidine kinase
MDRVADFIRTNEAKIAKRWEAEVLGDLPVQSQAARPVLVDHLHDFLDGLAHWIEGDNDNAERAFAGLVEGAALQRLGYGVGLETLSREYSKLRMVLVRELMDIELDAETRESMIRFHEGMDRAINDAMQRYASRREEVRERFISILGHDLRDPLATVRISANMLAANPALKNEHRLIATRISRAGARMQRMINDVLDFARGHLGDGIPSHPSPSDMGDVCRAAVDEHSAANPQRHISLDLRGDLHGAFDRDRVHQALGNLIANALHHTQGSIEVSAYAADDRVVTEVTSHGAPIPEELQQRIFDPFSRGEVSGPHKGLGLGMFIVHQIALSHGASCDITSDEQATTFTIRWPRGQAAARRKAG